MALTATANEQVMKDVIDRLKMKGCNVLTQSFNRPNLFYEIRPKKRNIVADICSFIKDGRTKDTGVIYCLSRRKCEEVAQELRDTYGLRAKHYHAQMSPDDKARTQNAWQKGECEIIVATVSTSPTLLTLMLPDAPKKIAFGMGIDKANGDLQSD